MGRGGNGYVQYRYLQLSTANYIAQLPLFNHIFTQGATFPIATWRSDIQDTWSNTLLAGPLLTNPRNLPLAQPAS